MNDILAQSDTSQLVGNDIITDSSAIDTSHANAIDSLSAIPAKQSKRSNQYQKISDDLEFVAYLITNELTDDALIVLSRYSAEDCQDINQRDSLLYYTGWVYYFQRDFEIAITYLSGLDTNSSNFFEASFFNAMCHIYLEEIEEAKTILTDIKTDSGTTYDALKYLELAGIALLERDHEGFDSLSARIPNQNYLVSQELISMQLHDVDLSNYKRKSPWLAGLLSTIVPGLGKIYVGYRGTPFGAMFITLPLAAMAVETLILAGPLGIPFLIVAPIFAVFYVGNIVGSVLSVYSFEKEFYDEVDFNIVYDMHIPLRRVLH